VWQFDQSLFSPKQELINRRPQKCGRLISHFSLQNKN
jgi:hypothetical protein